MQISFDGEGPYPDALAIRDEDGEYYQLALNKGARRKYFGDPKVVYTIGSLNTLPDIDGNVLSAVEQADPFNFDFRFWGGLLMGTLAGAIPIVLVWKWLGFIRSRRNG